MATVVTPAPYRGRWLRRLAPLALAVALAAGAGPAAGQQDGLPQPYTGELEADSSGVSTGARVAMDASGSFVAVWERYGDVYFSRYSNRGLRVSGPESISGPLNYQNEEDPDIAAAPDGRFVIVWSGNSGSDGSGIYAQRFTAAGVRDGAVILVNDETEGSQVTPRVAMGADGGFVVVWVRQSDMYEPIGPIFVRRFNASGEAQTEEDGLVSDREDASEPDLAANDRGDFVVAWSEGLSFERGDVFAARFVAATGTLSLIAGREPINPETQGIQAQPAVAIDADGGFVVAWRDNVGDTIDAQRFAPDAARRGLPFQVSGQATEDTSWTAPPAAAYGSFGIVFAWDYEGDVEDSGDNRLVWRAFTREGLPLSGDQPVAVRNVLRAEGADVSANDAGDFVVGWETEFSEVITPVVRLYRSPVSLSVGTDVAGVVEEGAPNITFTVFRSGAVRSRSQVGYRFGGTARPCPGAPPCDYTFAGGTAGVRSAEGVLAFEPGEITKTITLGVVDDGIGEPNKSIALELSEALPAGVARIAFPLAVVTLGDNDLSEVRVRQTGGSTVVVRGGKGDDLTVSLRTTPMAAVTVTLTPTSRQLNLGAGWGAPLSLTFPPGAGALRAQEVPVFTAGGAEGGDASLGQTFAIMLAASSEDPGYSDGARFTIDGRDGAEVPVALVAPPGSGPGILDLYLPLVQR